MHEELAREVIDVARAMDAAGFAPTKSGNVSARVTDGFLITPSGLPYAALTSDHLVQLDLAGTVRSRAANPSSEWRMHAAIYAARPETMAIVHTHSPRATALACARKGIPAFHYIIAYCGGADIRCAPYATFGTTELAENAVVALRDRKACLLANHGVIACGTVVTGAWAVAREVENLASQYLDLLAAGLDPVILDDAEMARVAASFTSYGKIA
jgi:L-fuculose-phosphate aldolase